MSTLITSLGILVFIGAVIVISKKMRKDQGNTLPPLIYVREGFTKIHQDFAKIPLYEGNKSYTENKSSITLCLRNENGKYYDRNTIMYVALHELAHVITKTYDVDEHGEEFRKNFDHLLSRGEQLRIYNSKIPIAEDYCGIID